MLRESLKLELGKLVNDFQSSNLYFNSIHLKIFWQVSQPLFGQYFSTLTYPYQSH